MRLQPIETNTFGDIRQVETGISNNNLLMV